MDQAALASLAIKSIGDRRADQVTGVPDARDWLQTEDKPRRCAGSAALRAPFKQIIKSPQVVI
jgi:hypothetical protein